jgi:O-antigen ligase
MPTYLKALIVILALASVVLAFAKAPVCASFSATADFIRRRNTWLAITAIAFLAHNFWIYAFAVGGVLYAVAARDRNKVALYFFLLFAVTDFTNHVSGFGLVNYLVQIGYLRLLALTILLPVFLYLRKQPDTDRFGALKPDKLIAAYIIIQFVLNLSAGTATNAIRVGLVYAFLDMFLPYYVASRALKNIGEFRDAMMSFSVAALILSAIGTFEAARHWLLYAGLSDALGISALTIHSIRGGDDGTLRAQATTQQPIVLGYLVAIAIAFWLYFRKSVPNRIAWSLGLLLLTAGLIAPLSRGPWVGVAAMLVVLILTGPTAAKNFAKLALFGAVSMGLLLASPVGERVIELLPFFGSADANVTYRQRLLTVSLDLIWDNPFFGSFDYINSAEMEEMRQGQGIIDIVNTYIAVGLGSGLVGLSLFAGFFLAVIGGLFRTIRNLRNPDDETYQLGQVLLAVLLGIIVMIGTVSSISFIPVVYWALAGVGVAYTRMVERQTVVEPARQQHLAKAGMPKYLPPIALH